MTTTIRPMFSGVVAACLFSSGIAGTAVAEEVTLSVVGSWSSLPLFKQYEEPFWTKTLPDEMKNLLPTPEQIEKTLKERNYPWQKPDSCPRCKSCRLWGHGFVPANNTIN